MVFITWTMPSQPSTRPFIKTSRCVCSTSFGVRRQTPASLGAWSACGMAGNTTSRMALRTSAEMLSAALSLELEPVVILERFDALLPAGRGLERRGSKLSKRLPATICTPMPAANRISATSKWNGGGGYLHPGVEIDDVLPARCRVPVDVVLSLGLAKDNPRREPGYRRRRGDLGRGHHRQGPLVAARRG